MNCSTFGTLVSPGTADAEGTLVSPGAAGAGLAVVRSDPHPAASAIADTTHSTIRIRGVRLDSRSGRRRTKRSCHLSRPIQPRPVIGVLGPYRKVGRDPKVVGSLAGKRPVGTQGVGRGQGDG